MWVKCRCVLYAVKALELAFCFISTLYESFCILTFQGRYCLNFYCHNLPFFFFFFLPTGATKACFQIAGCS